MEFNDAKQLTSKTPKKNPAASHNKTPTTESNEVERCSSENKSSSDTFEGPVVIERVFEEISMFKSVEQYQQITEAVLVEPEIMLVEAEIVPATCKEETVDEIREKIFGMIPSFGSIGAFKQYF